MEPEIRIDPGSLRKLVQASRTWDRVTRAEMRKGLRIAASGGAEAAKSEVRGSPPAGRLRAGRSRGLRSGLAKGVKVSIQSGRESKGGAVTGEGVRVTVNGSALPPDQQAMVKAYMAKQWRHPVFGRKVWVTQKGKNWFYNPLYRGRAEYQAAIVRAIEAASKEIENG